MLKRASEIEMRCMGIYYDLERMLRIYLLQNLYNLSDEATVR